MRSTGHKLRKAVLILAAVFAPTGAKAAEPPPLVIREQGSFAVGGTVVNTPGTYNNNAPTAAGQSLHGDHLYAFYQVPQNARTLPIVMLHGAYQSAAAGKRHRTDAKASRPFFCVVVFQFIWSINRGAAGPAIAPSR